MAFFGEKCVIPIFPIIKLLNQWTYISILHGLLFMELESHIYYFSHKMHLSMHSALNFTKNVKSLLRKKYYIWRKNALFVCNFFSKNVEAPSYQNSSCFSILEHYEMVEKSFSTIFTVHRSIKIKHVNKQLRLSKNIQDIKVVLTWYILALINVSSKVRQVYEKYY